MNEDNASDKSADASGIRISDAGKKYVAELIGTFVLVLTGCGTAVLAGQYVGWAFAFGFSFLAMFYVIGGISGCHINPAVSISMLAAGKIGVKDAVFYIVAQCAGAIIGAAALYAIAMGTPQYSLATYGLGQNGYDTASIGGFSMTSALIAEVLLTFIFVLVFHGSTSKKAPKGFAGIALGLTLIAIHFVGIPITGTSVNPARSLGPAIIVGITVGGTALSQLWLFWVAPIIGGLLAAAVWKVIQ
jgi:aquaporin Z